MSLDAPVIGDAPKDEDAKQLEAHRLMAAIEKKDASGVLNSLEKLFDLISSPEPDSDDDDDDKDEE